jgi:hypothetical protein
MRDSSRYRLRCNYKEKLTVASAANRPPLLASKALSWQALSASKHFRKSNGVVLWCGQVSASTGTIEGKPLDRKSLDGKSFRGIPVDAERHGAGRYASSGCEQETVAAH